MSTWPSAEFAPFSSRHPGVSVPPVGNPSLNPRDYGTEFTGLSVEAEESTDAADGEDSIFRDSVELEVRPPATPGELGTYAIIRGRRRP